MSKQQNDFYVALRQETENKVKAVLVFEISTGKHES
jgi:hypothetical protein